MTSSLQNIILKLQEFWAAHGCLIAQPYYTQVGAGTMNPATFLRVLGPEPWNVAYVEPSIRPDDGRYGENPNRFHQHTQFQVILKPDPGNPVELYLQSLEAIGINPRHHDIRLVEDNWEQPAIAAWGLGWEIWLDGQEITQFTYFQQVGGISLDPVSVEITYGLERILIALNNAAAIWDEPWGGEVTYGEVRRRDEYEHSKYYFDVGNVDRLRQMYELYKAEAEACIEAGLVAPAHDYVLKCSHTFNALDCRGAIGVTERQVFYGQMRLMARQVAERYLEQRKEQEYPLLKETAEKVHTALPALNPSASLVSAPGTLLVEIGVEEIPVLDLDSAVEQLTASVPKMLSGLRLEHGSITVYGTPRRLVVLVESLAPYQPDSQDVIKGPPVERSYAADGSPTQAAIGFARKNGVDVSALEIREQDGGRYVFAVTRTTGRPSVEILGEALPALIAGIKFDKSMRWNASSVSFSRPLRWFVALFGETLVPFEYAGLRSGNVTRGLRPYNSPEIIIPSAEAYRERIRENGILLDVADRKEMIASGVKALAASVNGVPILPPGLLEEVANLVEKPIPLLGSFDPEFLSLPQDVLVSVMKKHQRYFPICSAKNPENLLPYFVVIRNGDDQGLDLVRQGNEHVVRARFADANFFVREDLKHRLEDFRPRLGTLIFQKKLGSMLDKNDRIEKLTALLLPMLNLEANEAVFARRAAHLLKADLVTRMVVEMTSLQGIMGREYARRDGEALPVASAIGEQYLPVPPSKPGLAVAISDRLDSLVGLFAAGLAPSGAKDPFGLRRAAIGVVQPLIEHDLNFDLEAAVRAAATLQPLPVSEETLSQVQEFITGRLRVVLLDTGYKYDIVDAVLAAQAKNPAGSARAIRQLGDWVSCPGWSTLLPAYARCVRIIRSAPAADRPDGAVQEKVLEEAGEKALYASIRSVVLHPPATVDELLTMVSALVPAITTFFDQVLVMAEQPVLRTNRLALVSEVAALANGIADLSKLEGF